MLNVTKEANITEQQATNLFNSVPVQSVLEELENRLNNRYPLDRISYWLMLLIDTFNYGYILGKREERKRHNK